MILSARVSSRPIARDRGTGRWACLPRSTPTRHHSAVPGFNYGSCDVLVVEGLILFDVHVDVQDYDGGFDGSPSRSRLLDNSALRVPSQLADIPNVGFLNKGYRNFSPFSLNEQLSRSKFTSLQVGLYELQRYVVSAPFGRRSLRHVCVVFGSQGACCLAIRHLRPSHIIPFCSDSAF
ncbi:hypothetical protein EVAR_65215_1 [Eumeta japonica]|uniref:Uncharacterized protein n=1 Tax=Eumeta variegata TaxID=151549 RepID=A0A4C2A8F1_EUMVA|nr:hypothetical protein EVAR_65215_1 [Eumeta japonica]